MKKLDAITKFKNFFGRLNSDERELLWNFITALRGPDSGDESEKCMTTAVVRSYLLPPGCSGGNYLRGSTVNYESPLLKSVYPFTHFTFHLNLVINAIEKTGVKREGQDDKP